MTEQTLDAEFIEAVEAIIDKVRQRDTDEALSLIQQTIPNYPNSAELFLLTAVCSYQQNDVGRAIELCENAHKLSPDNQEVVDSLAVLHVISGNLNDGLYYAKLATTLEPHPEFIDLLPDEFSDFFAALNNATPSHHYLDGLYRFNFQLFDEAADAFQKELRLNPGNTDALRKLGHSYVKLGLSTEAISILEKCEASHPDDAELMMLLGMAHCNFADFEKAAEFCRKAMALAPDSIEIASRVLEVSIYFVGELCKYHQDFLAEYHQRIRNEIDDEDDQTSSRDSNADDKINVAVISNKLFEGDVATHLLPILELHNTSKFDITVYQQSPAGGSVFNALKSVATDWRRIVDMDDDVVDLILEREGIDIVLDLCGFGENDRSKLFAMSPGRIKTNLFCLPYGEGTAGTNLIISDAATQDVDTANLKPGQKTVFCDVGLFAIKPPTLMGEVSELPAQRNGHVTFGGTASLAQLSSTTIAYWVDVLNAVPDAQLYLGYVQNSPAEAKQKVSAIFAEHGLQDRVRVWNTDYDQRTNPTYFNEIDIFLDSSPVSVPLTVAHALWMGVPVITVKGATRSAVMGASVLNSAGKSDWIANDTKGAQQIINELCHDLDNLSAIRAKLRDDLRSSKLLDIRGYVKGLETVFTEVTAE